VAHPLAVIRAVLGVDAEKVVGGALHSVRARIDIGDAGIARVLARKRQRQPQKPRAKRKREVQRISAAARGFVAAPKRDQAAFLRFRLCHHRAQGPGLDH